MSNISVKPDKLRKIASEIERIELKLRPMIDEVTGVSTSLSASATNMKQVTRSLRQTAERIEQNSITTKQIGTVLQSIAALYRQAEKQLVSGSASASVQKAVQKAQTSIDRIIHSGNRVSGGSSSSACYLPIQFLKYNACIPPQAVL